MEMICNRCGTVWNVDRICARSPMLAHKVESILLCSGCPEFSTGPKPERETVLVWLDAPEMPDIMRARFINMSTL